MTKARTRKHIVPVMVLLIAVYVTLLAPRISAAGTIDTTKKGSVTIEIRDPDTDRLYAEQAEMLVYKVAELKTENGSALFEPLDAFAELNIDFNEMSDILNAEIVRMVQTHVADKALAATVTQSGTTGVFSFASLDLGVYLFCYVSAGTGVAQTVVEPFLAAVPMANETGDWRYSLTVYPKWEHSEPPPPPPPPPEEPPPEPKDPVLPNTGMLRWPIFGLSVLGILLFVLGWIEHYTRKERTYEKDK